MAPKSAQEKQADENVIASPPPIEVNSDTPGVAIEDLKGVDPSDDIGRQYYLQNKDEEISDEEKKRVRRKIDLYLLPMMMVTGFLQYLDKSTINYSANYGLSESLNMQGTDYSWASSIFFFGFLFWQYPSLLLLQRFPLGKYFASQVMGWGVLTFLMAASSNFGGFAALRFLLGAAESIQLAAFFIITNMWYTRDEQPIRLMAWYGMSPIAIIVGSLFAYGIGHIDSKIGLWRFPFIICGAVSVVWAVVLWFALPSNPASAWFLEERERIVALRRMEDAKTGVESKKFKMDQAIEAFRDPKVWLAGLSTGSGNILNGIGLFQSLVIRGFGFTPLQTALLQVPTGVIEIIGLIVFCTLASRVRNSRLAFASLANALAIVGASMLYGFDVDQRWRLMAGYVTFWAMMAFIPCSFLLGMGTISGNIAGHTKKVTAQAIMFTCYCCGCIVGPQLYTTPPYRQGLRANIVSLAVSLFAGISNIAYMHYENRKRRAFLEEHRHLLNEDDYYFRDLTDKQNPFILNVL
ncbi:allantoate permease [Fusarium redolens]|uniref:Allantoate permease n=1 Tax=Fusarium redolens TaxID=48865 RepID=A0A9P9KFA5_FUSRE|nr:allantoate permease [Fusarium redolens]KAH7255090.1 allantoate permease [Fusarium redolens]